LRTFLVFLCSRQTLNKRLPNGTVELPDNAKVEASHDLALIGSSPAGSFHPTALRGLKISAHDNRRSFTF